MELNNVKTDRDVLKHVADFFYESIVNFKRTLNDLTISINHFLNSLSTIENHLGTHGYTAPGNSSDVLYERLLEKKLDRKRRQEQRRLQQDKVPVLPIEPAVGLPRKEPVAQPQRQSPPKAVLTPKQEIMKKLVKIKPQEVRNQKPLPQPVKRVETRPPPKTQYSSLDELKREMLGQLRNLKKIMKGQMD